MTDAELIEMLRSSANKVVNYAAARIEQLERELSISRMAQVVMDNSIEQLQAQSFRLSGMCHDLKKEVAISDALLISEAEVSLERLAHAEKAEAERERLALAICGGEDAPGYANAQTVETLEYVAKQNERAHGATINSLLAAEADNALLRGLLSEADQRLAWESLGFGNDFADRVEAALTGKDDT